MRNTRQDVLHFWFEETEPPLWFQASEDFAAVLRERFHLTCDMARDGLCDDWKQDAEGCLALCLVLDQFPRHIFRGTPAAYAGDGRAVVTAKYAIAKGFDQVLTPVRRRFLYLPFQHSEKRADQHRSVELFESMKDADPVSYEHALRNMNIIERFDRFPQRNEILGRDSTPEENEYLAERRLHA